VGVLQSFEECFHFHLALAFNPARVQSRINAQELSR
jgi:hypothetical protein